jgi:hypothetical protein
MDMGFRGAISLASWVFACCCYLACFSRFCSGGRPITSLSDRVNDYLSAGYRRSCFHFDQGSYLLSSSFDEVST